MPTRERRAQSMGIPVDQLPDGRGRHGNHARGSRCARWNDDRLISSEGYVKIRVGADHPLADPNGYAYEHLMVWCAAGRPRPKKDYLLHHLNEDRQDNRLSNLELKTRGEHNSLHLANHPRDSRGRLLPKRAGRLLNGVTHNAMPRDRP